MKPTKSRLSRFQCTHTLVKWRANRNHTIRFFEYNQIRQLLTKIDAIGQSFFLFICKNFWEEKMKIHPPAEWNILCQSVFSSPLDLSRQIIPKTLLANSAAPIKSPNPTRNSFYVISLHLHFEAITASFNLSSMFFLQSLNNS